jgi:fructose-1,6-bisphosphatase I
MTVDAPLRLPGDAATIAAPTLGAHLSEWAGTDARRAALAEIATAIAAAAVPLARRLALAALPGDPAAPVGTNETGDTQKALDLAAHARMLEALSGASVANVLSEEAPEPIRLSADGFYDVAIDPIDGSGSIGIGAPVGLLFAVFPRSETFLRAGREAVAAGYVSFGHSTDLGLTLGAGVTLATFDTDAGAFRVTVPRAEVPRHTRMIAYNASNVRHFAPGLRRYVDDCLAGADGPRRGDTNMRWIAAAVGDLHRILLTGGVFLYPADARPGYAAGHIRLLYEAVPIALLMEQAGGAATDGIAPILGQVPDAPHAKTPLVFGAADEVATVATYLTA